MQIPKFVSSDVVIMDSGREKVDVASVIESEIIMIEHPLILVMCGYYTWVTTHCYSI